MKTISTFNAFHLGDNLVHLHFLRALAKAHPEIAFEHGAPDEHLAQLYPVWSDLPNLRVKSIGEIAYGALNAWRGTEGHWYSHPDRLDFAKYHLRWFEVLAGRMGLASPFTKPTDLLFDYPKLRNENQCLDHGWDFLLVNSEPKSGQFAGHSSGWYDDFIAYVGWRRCITTARTNTPALCTADLHYDVTAIGAVSQVCRAIIGCVTGPMWPTLNIWNSGIPELRSTGAAAPLRIHLLDTERVELVPNTVHTNSLSLVPEILREHGLL